VYCSEPVTRKLIMAKISVRLPIGLVGPGGSSREECEGHTVLEALNDCVSRRPALRTRIFRPDGTVWVGIFLNGRNIRQREGLETVLEEGDEIRILPPIAGG
jgi:molybdopterin converting factor small subunit